MFKWRSDKNKVKAVFKLQFHVTQLTQLRGDGLVISVIPADVGKPTSRLEKAKVKDGSCYWEKPHYETVKFNQDPKTGKILEKIYHFVVATGSQKFSCTLGEVSIDFAGYSEATKLSSLSLPLKTENSAAVFHVTIQRVHESNDRSEVDQHDRSITSQDRSLRAKLSNGDVDGSMRTIPTEQDNGTLPENINRNRRVSSGSDITLSGSESSSGLDTPREPERKNSKPPHESSTPTTIFEEQHQRSSQWDWLDGSAPELSTDDSSTSPRDTLLREISEEGSAADVIKKLKSELAASARQAEFSDLELQTLRKQIVKESKKGQDLLREVASLKEECEKLRADSKRSEVKVNNMLLIEEGDPWALLSELRQELNYEKDLNSNLRLQLQKTQESNAELILAVRDLDEMLEQKDMETSRSKYHNPRPLVNAKSETDDDEEQKALEEIVREHNGGNEAYLLEQKIMDLYSEMELCKRDKDELEIQMEQLALDYEILKQENHDMSYKLEQSQLQEQLKMQYECTTSYATVKELEKQIESLDDEVKVKSKELEDSLFAIKELETHVKNLEEDLDAQARGFEADIEDLMREKVEHEQRAIRAEENLRKTRLQNAQTAERLQEEFRRLSTQMASTFEANEKVAMKAMDEANQLRAEKRYLEEVLEKVKEDFQCLGEFYEGKLVDLSNQMTLKSNQLEKMQKQIVDMSNKLQQQKTSYRAETTRLMAEKQNLEDDKRKLEDEICSTKLELTEVMGANEIKDNEIKRLQSEVERLKSRCSDMKESFVEYETEKEKLWKQVSQLKADLKKKEESFNSMEKKLKDSNNRVMTLEGSKSTLRNNKPLPVPPRSSKEVSNLKDRIKLLEDQIKQKEAALENSETSFLEKEKDLQHKIEDLEKRLEVLYENIENSQASSADNSTTTTISHDEENFNALSNEMELLKSRNKSMEVELKEMQERYSEISLKFAEVEGERQQLVMALRNIKNSKKC